SISPLPPEAFPAPPSPLAQPVALHLEKIWPLYTTCIRQIATTNRTIVARCCKASAVFFMLRPLTREQRVMLFSSILLLSILATWLAAQDKSKTAPTEPVAAAKQAVTLAEQGRCSEALPILTSNIGHVADKQLRYRFAMAAARCGMSLNNTAAVLD